MVREQQLTFSIEKRFGGRIKMKKLIAILALLIVSLLSLTLVSAAFDENVLSVERVKVNGEEVDVLTPADLNGKTVDNFTGEYVTEGETLDVDVFLESSADVEDVQVEVELRGYEYDDYEDVDDRSHLFDIEGTADGTSRKRVDLSINLPQKLDDDRYLLRITVDDKDSASLVRYVVLRVEPSRHGVSIADVAFSPGHTLKAGRSLLTTVLLRNYGDKTEKDVQTTVSIPALGVSSSTETLDLLEVDRADDGGSNIDYEDVPEMFLQIPANAAAGDYEVVVTVKYDDLRETITHKSTITVVENEMFASGSCEKQLVVVVGPETQTVGTNQAARYGFALQNNGACTKAYSLETVVGDWASASLSENVVLLTKGQSKVVYLELTPRADAPNGLHTASVVVKSGDNVLKTVNLNANVVNSVGSSSSGVGGVSLRNGLEIALVVLVVLLVIVGLIIGFSRLRKDEDEEQTYY